MTVPGNLSSPLLATAAADGAAAAGVATRSLRFNDGDSAYLNRTPSSAGNRKTFTLSCWVKRCSTGSYQAFFSAYQDSNDFHHFRFRNDEKFETRLQVGGSDKLHLITDQVFRDFSAWYHVVFAYDSTQSTASNRAKLYINGSQVTGFSTETYPSQNDDSYVANTTAHYIGQRGDNNLYHDGYLADVHLIDGSALTPTSFGAFDSNGVWQAAAYSGTFGTNGLHLSFSDASSNAALGTDSSGNDNDFTVNNLVASAPATAKGGFDVVTYTGNGSTQSISSLAFQPDLVWTKKRNSAQSHHLTDSVRGALKNLRSNTTGAETTDSNTLTSFDSNGFSVGSESGFNGNNDTFVAFCWKAGGTAVSNTDGTITSSVSANTDYGFSIVSYTGTGANATIGHGLNATPKWIIAKTRDSAVNWIIYHASLSSDGFLRFTTAAEDNNTTVWNTAPTSSVFGVGSANGVNESGDDYIAYCWSEVSGFSKFDTYTGTGSAGLTITTGFKPRYVLIRRIAGGDWFIFDNERDSTNPVYARLYANLTNAEDTGTANGINFLDDGFSIPTTHAGLNASSAYIYAAFSAQPPGDLVDSLFDSPANGAQSDTGAGGEVSGSYATLNPLDSPLNSFGTPSNGNLEFEGSSAAYHSLRATISIPSTGKWYYESTLKGTAYTPRASNSQYSGVGFAKTNVEMSSITDGNQNWIGDSGYGLNFDGTRVEFHNAVIDGGDVVGVAINRDANTFEYFVNGTSVETGTIGVASGTDLSPFVFVYGTSYTTHVLNFGQRAFAYSAPSGYKALCTTNLPTPTIADGSDFFDVITRNGLGSSGGNITGLGFSPDLVWEKARNTSSDHYLMNTVRGATKDLRSNKSDTENTNANYLTAFNSDGYTVGSADWSTSTTVASWTWDAGANSNKTYTVKVVSDSGNKYRFDDFGTSAVTLDLEEGSTYVFDQSDSSNSGHPLRFSTTSDGTHNSGSEYTTGVTTTGTPGSAGAKTTIVVAASAPTLYYYCSVHSGMGGQANTNSTAGASNFDGTIQAKVRANASAGFSIVEYGGTGSNGTFGHGLNAAPAFVLFKKYNGSDNWMVYHESVGNTKFLKLNDTTAATTKASFLNSTSPTSSVISIGTDGGVNSSIKDFIAFCWAPVAGYSAFGSYTGNGSASNGPFVALSFRPAFLLLKRTDSTSTWLLYDNKREGYNFNNDPLYPNLDATEGTTDYIDLLSNGFKIRNTHGNINGSGGTYSYAAFASNPFSSNGGLAR